MTTELPIPSGPTVKEIVDLAFSAMGSSDSMFGRTENEYADALVQLNAMMSEWPFDQLGYVIEDAAGLRMEEESGIDRGYMAGVAYSLAERMAPNFGKMLSPNAMKVKAQTYSHLCSSVAPIPEAQYADGTPRGTGHRNSVRTTAYFSKAE